MKRFLSFLLGLFLLVLIGTFLFLYVDYSSFTAYQQQLQSYSWFEPTLYSMAAAGLLLALILIVYAFTPSHKKRGLYLSYNDGNIYMNKRSIEKVVLHTLNKYDAVRQPIVTIRMYQKKHKSYIDIATEFFVLPTGNIQTLLERIKEDIKIQTEHFSEIPVREVNIKVLDQKELKKRVI
ncbi:alkaline shock response membrane anchor protein AmaP [Kurthia huakuii]|uniref:alkaline shock response membrane anchor protein AmaP n=1 Tax=Kurthia huakuii TaxID=1421019 RepID=UPI00049664DE|nr:alkaline shock response membrane anchor protein AmaP [Kurthia huakuii]MBM7699649.1 putative alkaline shock family protein YloU [Kurthia huakuii]